MPPLPHRIRRLSLRARAASPSQALALRKQLHDQLDPALFNAMERAFDRAGARDEVIHLSSVHVRVRVSSMDALAGELARCLEQELRRQLGPRTVSAERPSTAFQTGPSGAEGMKRTGVAVRAPGMTDATAGATAASLQARVRMLVHYLETGSCLWPLAQVGPAVAVSELRDVASADLPEMLDGLTEAPASFPARVAFWFRWLQLLPDVSGAAVARTAALPSTGLGVSLAELIDALSGAQARALSRYARLQLSAAAIAWARRPGGLAEVGELSSLVLHVLGGDGAEGQSRSAWAERSSGVAAGAMSGSGSRARCSGGAESHASGALEGAKEDARSSSARVGVITERGGFEEQVRISAASELAARLPEPVAAAFRAWLLTPDDPPRAASAPMKTDVSPVGMTRGGPAERQNPPLPRPEPGLAALPEGTRASHSRTTGARPAPFGQRVHHAGLVLLHPFLPRFLESTASKQAGLPALASGALPRAAALLHLLAAGAEEVFEFELDVVKVLLGLPLDAPLPVSEGLLRASDHEEAEGLLCAVIGHWRVLKSTSVRGLRESFLQRPGLLREDAQGLRLQVESAPFDLLLEQLPWGIGTVKLPWMKRALFTDWPAP